jgi:hypothetical protein
MAQRVQMNITYGNHKNPRTEDTHLTAGVFCYHSRDRVGSLVNHRFHEKVCLT